MITLQITESTPHNMLRAIRAACNELLGETHADLTTQAAQHNSRAEELRIASERELDKSASCLTAHTAERETAASPALAAPYGQGGPVDAGQFYRVGDNPTKQIVWTQGLNEPPMGKPLTDAPETDSAGHAWNAELHASTKAKNQDGTWKKRRGASQPATTQEAAGSVDTVDVSTIQDQPGAAIKVGLDAVPPVPPAPTATAEPIMPKIFALITSQIVTINQAVEAAQAEGFADLGANGLGGAPREAQEAVLRKLEG